jgi:peptidoglycan/LPS O-acetylase OafA/YrhL
MQEQIVNVSHKNNKLLGLEIVRFISALSVLVWHYQHFFFIADKPVNFLREQQPLHSFLGFFYAYGFYGVQVFWCISGFIFFWKYKSLIAEKTINSKKFFLLRFSRLYPLHIATLLLVILLQSIYFAREGYYFVYQNNDIKYFLLQLVMASNWLPQLGFSFNGPIWSVSVEVFVYLIFFLTLRYVGKSFTITLGIFSLCFIANYLLDSVPIIECASFFYAGGLSAAALKYSEQRKLKSRLKNLAFFAIIAILMIAYDANMFKYYKSQYLFLTVFVPILLFISTKNFVTPPVIQKTIEAAGNMTYSSYLIHFPIQLLIVLFYSKTNQIIPYYSVTFFVMFILVTLAVSYCIYRFFELPVQNYIRARVM